LVILHYTNLGNTVWKVIVEWGRVCRPQRPNLLQNFNSFIRTDVIIRPERFFYFNSSRVGKLHGVEPMRSCRRLSCPWILPHFLITQKYGIYCRPSRLWPYLGGPWLIENCQVQCLVVLIYDFLLSGSNAISMRYDNRLHPAATTRVGRGCAGPARGAGRGYQPTPRGVGTVACSSAWLLFHSGVGPHCVTAHDQLMW
jgi:hypothetical protein